MPLSHGETIGAALAADPLYSRNDAEATEPSHPVDVHPESPRLSVKRNGQYLGTLLG